ncbi:MAG: ABC transporter permease subunit [Humidesulfovibrio sp.]|uniref:phosphate ABC transporter permease n=1 Tax=Humidesulfovibrio sp. TaxID=2910988 RepID=UPI0027E94162|nr:ABC transporter permease subunit [Humidesulfovibrio sp.]MDQ7836158.1 ABC transporter permease subunit [Humidesulfovibrio sp.]
MADSRQQKTRGMGRGDLPGEGIVTALLFGASAVSVLCVAGILAFLAWFCLPLVTEGQSASVLSWTWRPASGQFGILPMAVGSLLLGSSALLLAWPLGLGLTLFAHGLGPAWPNFNPARPLMALVRLMTSVPTVVYGLASVFLLVPLVRSGFSGGSGFSWLAAALTLALLVLPTIVLVLDGQLRLVTPGLRLTAAALGLTRTQELVHLALPLCGRGLKTAAVLGFGRAVGDTLLPLMLSGNAAQVPGGPLDSLRTLTAHIALVVATDSQSAAYTSLFACGALLFGMSQAVNLGLRGLRPVQATLSAPRRLSLERLARALAWTSALAVPAGVCALLGYLLWRGLPTLGAALFFGDTPPLDALLHGAAVFDGLWPACLGTLYLVLVASCLAIPLGVASGIHLAEFATGRAGRLISSCVDLLAGVPSILMGLFGFGLILLLRHTLWPRANTCLLLSALCLALLVLPYLISATRTCLEALPRELRLTAASLGLTRWQTVSRVLLPAASRGVLGGIILAVGRAAEDTAVIMLTGVVVGAGTPGALTDKFEALPFTIYYLAAEHQSPQELDLAFGAALTLLCLTALLFALARSLRASLLNGKSRRWGNGTSAYQRTTA